MIPMMMMSWMAAQAAESECHFTDVIAAEVRECEDGPAKASWSYLAKDKFGDLRLTKEVQQIKLFDLGQESMTGGGDPDYDSDSDEQSAFEQLFESLWTLLKLLVALAGGYEQFLDDIGLTGEYDGRVWGPDGSTALAYLDLQHHGSEVHGTLMLLEESLVLDGGICGDFAVPMVALPVHAATTGPFAAEGGTSREVGSDPFGGTLDVTFEMSLETTEHRYLYGSLFIDVPWPCANQALTVQLTRRNDQLF
jgi:hypothetical protein